MRSNNYTQRCAVARLATIPHLLHLFKVYGGSDRPGQRQRLPKHKDQQHRVIRDIRHTHRPNQHASKTQHHSKQRQPQQ